jgi:hypothetical protein
MSDGPIDRSIGSIGQACLRSDKNFTDGEEIFIGEGVGRIAIVIYAIEYYNLGTRVELFVEDNRKVIFP